jgi:acyl carrier protein phosphodiesterase
MQIAVSQLPTNKLAAYIRGRRDEQKAIESLIQAMQIDRTLDIATGHMVMGYLATLDRRPKVQA